MAKAHCMGQYIKMSTFSLNFNNLKPLNVWSFDVTLNPKTSYFSKDLIKRAMKWGMKSIAITDHGVVQAFPEAHKLLGYDNKDMKIIYGVPRSTNHP